METPPVLATFK